MNDDDDIASLVEELRAKVATRRQAGEYPDDLEAKLDAHFDRLASHGAGAYDFDALRTKLAALDAAGAFDANAISYETRLPGGRLVHRMLGKLVRRQTEGVLAQAQRHANAVRDVAWEVLTALEAPAAHTHVDLVREIEAIADRVTSHARAASGPGALAALTDRVAALEAAAVGRFDPWYDARRFADRFRGSRDDVVERYRDLAAEFAGMEGRVVDLGCGRGEFLELLVAEGVDAFGIDVDPDLVDECVARDLPASFGEAAAWLGASEDGALAGAVLIQVVEHLTAQQLADLVRSLAVKVRAGGKVVVETVNPLSLYTFAHAYTLDPSHERPVHPAYLTFLFEEAGFSHVRLAFRSPCPPDDRLEGSDENVRRVNDLLFADQDYALIAVR